MATEIKWDGRFARRASLMKRSAVREILKVASRPEIISFAGGLPAAHLFPMRRVKAALTAVINRVGPEVLQYSRTEGITELRDWLAQHFSTRRFQVNRENVLITTGGQQALDLIGRILLDEGDKVVVENPTYLALLSAWRPTGAKFLPISGDAGGMRVEELEPLLRQKPKAIYCVPNFQNPQGTTLTLSRRRRLLELARRYSVIVVEDDPYGELRYGGKALPSLLQLDARNGGTEDLDSRVIHVGTFSKVLMPGLRIGWVIAPRAVIDKLTQAKQAADLHTSTLDQHLAFELVTTGFLDEFLPVLQLHYAARRDAMLGALEKYFPKDATWTKPDGGMFVMVTLPNINASELLPKALKAGVAYVPGEEFHMDGEGKNTMRLNFTNALPKRIEAGIKALAGILPCG
jgi:2-aminoadipate transaminase